MNNLLLMAVDDFSIADAGITAIFGYIIVFIGLAVLMAVLHIMSAFFKSKEKKTESAKQQTASAEKTAEKPPVPTAPGSAGHVKLYDVPDKEAAMIMAIVADKLQTPLNELHFISIKEVK